MIYTFGAELFEDTTVKYFNEVRLKSSSLFFDHNETIAFRLKIWRLLSLGYGPIYKFVVIHRVVTLSQPS